MEKNKAINYQRLLKQVIKIGGLLIECGAEIYRVEESIRRMLNAYPVESVDVFAIPSMIMVTLETPTQVSITKNKRTFYKQADFNKLARLNNLVRDISIKAPSLDVVEYSINAIEQEMPYPRWIVILATACLSGTFCLLVQGGFYSALCAGAIVVVSQLVSQEMEKFHANTFFITIVASFIHTTLAGGIANFFPSTEIDAMIIGTLVTILPGLTFTTAIRDMITRDLLAGILGLIETLLVATSIAIGNSLAYLAISRLWEVF